MSTNNICFRGEIRKIFTGYPPLSRPMSIGTDHTVQMHRIICAITVHTCPQRTRFSKHGSNVNILIDEFIHCNFFSQQSTTIFGPELESVHS